MAVRSGLADDWDEIDEAVSMVQSAVPLPFEGAAGRLPSGASCPAPGPQALMEHDDPPRFRLSARWRTRVDWLCPDRRACTNGGDTTARPAGAT